VARLQLRPRRGAHHATTAHLSAAQPFQAASGSPHGLLIGLDAHRAAYCHDPFVLYSRGYLTGLATVVLGEIGRGKSAFVKSYLYRQCGVFGRRAVVISPKPAEYDRLAAEFGVQPIRLAPGGSVRLNPLAASALMSASEAATTQTQALRDVAGAALGRALEPAESAALGAALACVRTAGLTPTLPRVVEALFAAPQDAWEARWRTREQWLAESREAALALDGLVSVHGHARGMFDGETSNGISLDAPLVVLDLSAVRDSSAIAILITATLGWVHAEIRRETDAEHHKRIIVCDEAWRVLANPSAAEALLDATKHSRAYGVQPITVVHKIADLAAAGDTGTRLSTIADGLLSDAETKVVFAQSDDQVALARERLGLTSTEAAALPALGRGEALWRVGTRSYLVSHVLSRREEWLCHTDARVAEAGLERESA
jgi:hypothetical protein